MRESVAARRARAGSIVATLRTAYPQARVALEYDTPFQLLVATILSAQCTDQRVNMVTPGLFRKWRDAAAFARAPRPALEKEIRSTGFFRAKARSIQGASRALLERHGGAVPRTMEEMVRLPGVGRKTANVVLGAAYGIPAGVVVDTHVARVSARLGLTKHSDPVKIEQDLMGLVPREAWIFISIAVILHGRAVCQARRPRCSVCPLFRLCPSNFLEQELPKARSAAGTAGLRSPRPAASARAAPAADRPRRSPDRS